MKSQYHWEPSINELKLKNIQLLQGYKHNVTVLDHLPDAPMLASHFFKVKEMSTLAVLANFLCSDWGVGGSFQITL